VHNSRNGGFAAARIRIFVGHVWLLFGLFQLARGTRRRRNRDKKKEPPRQEWLMDGSSKSS
jgi:hypothetical protein